MFKRSLGYYNIIVKQHTSTAIDSLTNTKIITNNENIKVKKTSEESFKATNPKDEGLLIFTEDELVIYPSPFNDKFTAKFNLDEDGSVDIYLISITGSIMKKQTGNFKKGLVDLTIEVNVPDGVYIVKVIAKGKKPLYKKIIRVGSI